MVIKAFDQKMYCCVNDKYIYALEEVPIRENESKDFDTEFKPEKKEPKKRYIPPMNHPWRSQTFMRFVLSQQHHLMDNLEACM